MKSSGRPKNPARARLSVSLENAIAKKVREFASNERTSDSAVVEVALLEFFNSGSPAILHAVLERLGIATQRRNP